MSELPSVNISEMFNVPLPSTQQRLEKSYQDPVVQGWARAIMYAPVEVRPDLEAQMNCYLAAAYALFPEESQVIHDSLGGDSSDG
jgi:hypothetical protein